jgi:hypothetical protein
MPAPKTDGREKRAITAGSRSAPPRPTSDARPASSAMPRCSTSRNRHRGYWTEVDRAWRLRAVAARKRRRRAAQPRHGPRDRPHGAKTLTPARGRQGPRLRERPSRHDRRPRPRGPHRARRHPGMSFGFMHSQAGVGRDRRSAQAHDPRGDLYEITYTAFPQYPTRRSAFATLEGARKERREHNKTAPRTASPPAARARRRSSAASSFPGDSRRRRRAASFAQPLARHRRAFSCPGVRMTLREMQEKREQLVAQARAALDEIRSNTDDSRAAELEQRHDTIMAEFDKLEKDIAREERRQLEKDAEERRAKQRPTGEDGDRPAARTAASSAPSSSARPSIATRSKRSCAAAATSARSSRAAHDPPPGFVAEQRVPRPPARPRPAATPCRRSSPTRSSGHEGLRSDVRPGRHARDRHQLGQRVRHPDERRHGQFGRGARRRRRHRRRQQRRPGLRPGAPRRLCRRDAVREAQLRADAGLGVQPRGLHRRRARRAPRPARQQQADRRHRHGQANGIVTASSLGVTAASATRSRPTSCSACSTR